MKTLTKSLLFLIPVGITTLSPTHASEGIIQQQAAELAKGLNFQNGQFVANHLTSTPTLSFALTQEGISAAVQTYWYLKNQYVQDEETGAYLYEDYLAEFALVLPMNDVDNSLKEEIIEWLGYDNFYYDPDTLSWVLYTFEIWPDWINSNISPTLRETLVNSSEFADSHAAFADGITDGSLAASGVTPTQIQDRLWATFSASIIAKPDLLNTLDFSSIDFTGRNVENLVFQYGLPSGWEMNYEYPELPNYLIPVKL
jgi:hypothetical protein